MNKQLLALIICLLLSCVYVSALNKSYWQWKIHPHRITAREFIENDEFDADGSRSRKEDEINNMIERWTTPFFLVMCLSFYGTWASVAKLHGHQKYIFLLLSGNPLPVVPLIHVHNLFLVCHIYVSGLMIIVSLMQMPTALIRGDANNAWLSSLAFFHNAGTCLVFLLFMLDHMDVYSSL